MRVSVLIRVQLVLQLERMFQHCKPSVLPEEMFDLAHHVSPVRRNFLNFKEVMERVLQGT